MFNIFKKHKKDSMVRIKVRSNVIQYDSMGYPLRLCIMDNDDQMWIDTSQQDGDVVLRWKY